MLYKRIKRLVQYGINTGLVPECERIYTTNLLLELYREENNQEVETETRIPELEEILADLLDEAEKRGMVGDTITERDLFDTKLMNCLMPRPSQVQKEFVGKYRISPRDATEYFYRLSQDSNYIRRHRIAKDMKWKVESPYGNMDITINLSKPEKDPREIAEAKLVKSSSYPKCLLCMENEGYAGGKNHPARENLRMIPLVINGSKWGFQYSPYVYYNEHCIVFNGSHIPMKIEKETFVKLFDFVKLFPHYFLGSNADLPIVGGSILSHDHFQGGNYQFPMAKASIEQFFVIQGYEDVEAGIVKWPMSVIRLRSKDEERLIELGAHILEKWRTYSDEAAFIFAETESGPHNTVTPIARKVMDSYELDLVLRNNITTDENPWGKFHPREELHHIKKENIGLIEVMGLAVLPARLKNEMDEICHMVSEGKRIRDIPSLEKHAEWVEQILPKYGTITETILQKEIGQIFVQVLEDAGVFKYSKEGREAFERFIRVL